MPYIWKKASLWDHYETHRDEIDKKLRIDFTWSPKFLDEQSREAFRDELIETTKSDIRYILNANDIWWTTQRDFMQSFKEIFKNIFDHANNTATCLLEILTHNDAKENTTVMFTVEDNNTEIVDREELLKGSGSTKRVKKWRTNKGSGLTILDIIAKWWMAEMWINLSIDTTQWWINYSGSITTHKDNQWKVNSPNNSIYQDRSITI